MAPVFRGQVPKGVRPPNLAASESASTEDSPPTERTAEDAAREGRKLNDRLDPHSAIRCLREALDLDPGHSGAACELALTLLDMGRTAEGLQTLEGFVHQNPRAAEARLAWARCLLRTGDFDGAARECRTCLTLRPNWDAPHPHLIHALCQTDRAQEARDVLSDLARFAVDPRQLAFLRALIDRSL